MVFATRSKKYNDVIKSNTKSNIKYKNKNSKREQKLKTKKTKKGIRNEICPVCPVYPVCPVCPVCYDDIEKKNYIVTNCNHTFCNNCLFKSLKKKSCCPICREEIFNFNEINDLEDNDVIDLETRISEFKKQLTLKTLYELKKAILFSVNTNKCECLSSTTLNIISNYFHCIELNKLLYLEFSKIIHNSFSILSLTSYENLHDWLKR